MSKTNNTQYRTNPNPRSTSTVKKSAPAIAPRCDLMKVCEFALRPRSGAGSIPCSLRMALIVFRAMSCPRLESAPLIRVYPQDGFSRAMRITSFLMSGFLLGLPGPLAFEPSYLAATRLPYHRSSVSGVTTVPRAASVDRPIVFAFSASRRRCAFVQRG